MTRGQVFINQNPGSPERIWVVATEPATDGSVCILPIEPMRRDADTTRLVSSGDHPAVARPSFVNYEMGRLLPREAAQNLERLGAARFVERIRDQVLLPIRDGAKTSPFIARKVRAAIEHDAW